MQDRTFIEIQAGIPEHRNSKYYRLNSVENNHGSWLLVGILQLAGNQLLGILKITVVVQYNTVGIWLPVPVVIYFQSLVWTPPKASSLPQFFFVIPRSLVL